MYKMLKKISENKILNCSFLIGQDGVDGMEKWFYNLNNALEGKSFECKEKAMIRCGGCNCNKHLEIDG